MKKNLCARTLETLKIPAKGERPYERPDGQVPGLSVRVTNKGTKTFYFKYRHQREIRRITIGHFPKMSLAVARVRAQLGLSLVKRGQDPASNPDVALKAPEVVPEPFVTFEVAVDRFNTAYSKPNHSPRHNYEIMRVLNAYFIPSLKDLNLKKIKKSHLLDIIDPINASKRPSEAIHARKYILAFFNWCEMRDMLETNPCYKLPRPAKEVKRAHVINDDDLATIWHAATLEGYPFGTIVKLLMLTLQRRAEVAGMRRSELDFKNNVWILPPHRTKNGHEHRVPMTPRFKAIIKTIPFNKDSDLLFPNITNPDKPFQSFGNAKANLDITAGITGWTLHDLRRTGDTRLAGYLVPKEDREKLMNHLSGMFKGVGGIYDRNKYEKQKANALRVWAAHLKRSTKAHKPALKPRPDHWALTIKRPLAARLATRAYRKKRRAAAKAA